MALFNRMARLTVGQPGKDGVVIEELRLSFEVDKDLTQQTNKGNIKVYNLSPATRKLIERPDSVCRLDVGYLDDIGPIRIFQGNILEVDTEEEGTDSVTKIELADGQKILRDSALSVGYAAGVNGRVVAQDIAAQMGVLLHIASDVAFPDYPNGFSFVGYARKAIDKICNAAGAIWSVQNGDLQIIMGGGTTNVRALFFSADSGLVGVPKSSTKGPRRSNTEQAAARKKQLTDSKRDKRQEKSGWKIKTLLAPTLNPGDLVRVESKIIKGWYKVESVKHSGDTHGATWYSEQELSEVITDESK